MSEPTRTLRPGSCFKFAEKETHLWIVLSDPDLNPDLVLLVNCTTLTPRKDKSCVLRGGCHSLITHDSCINYGEARTYSAEHLESLLTRDRIYLCDSMPSEIYKRIWDNAILSPCTHRKHSDLLLAQGRSDPQAPPPEIDF